MKYLFLLIVVVIAQVSFGQSVRLRKADEAYNLLSYASAAEQYESLLGTSVDSPAVKSRLANSYYQIGKTQDAARVYASYINPTTSEAEDIYRYAQSLKQNGNYSESDNWMMRFAELAPFDQRARDFISSRNYLDVVAGIGNHFTIDTLAINTVESDFGGYINKSSGEVYFVSARRNPAFFKRIWQGNERPYLDLYTTNSTSSTDVKRFSPANTVYHEGPVCFSSDGKMVLFTRNNIAAGKRDASGIQRLKIYIADIAADGTWKNEREFAHNAVDYSVGHPAFSNDGSRLYFASTMPGTKGGADIFYCTVLADGTFGPAVNAGSEINTEGQEMFPWIGPDDALFFASDGLPGLGGLDVFVAQPSGTGFKKPVNAGKPLNSEKDDFALAFRPGSMQGYFSSDRDGGRGSDDIYGFTLVKPFKTQLLVKGVAMDKTGAPLANSVVNLKDQSGNDRIVQTGDNGAFSFELEPDQNYVLAGSKNGYFDDRADITTLNLAPETTELVRNLVLEKDPGLALRATVTDAGTGQPLDGVTLIITDKRRNTPFAKAETDVSGQFMQGLTDKKVGEEISYTVVLQKEGYLSKTVDFKTTIAKPGIIDVTGDLSMSRLEIGGDLAKLIDIKPIYFDYGKYVIRPDAAKELDKIVAIMKEYPTMEIELGSHTDCRGSMASNEKLSDNRAKASAAYIKSRIPNPERIFGKGYGEARLKNGCGCEGTVKSTCSEAEHQENRRTEFIIMKM